MALLKHLFRSPSDRRAAEALYATAVAQARLRAFYGDSKVPDTLDGRFDMVALHVFLILHRLKGDARAKPVAQALFDTMFTDMDRGLRELGAGDLGVGRRVKVMAKAFYGRVAAYEQGLSEGEASLTDAVVRNVFRGAAGADAAAKRIASYMYQQVRALERQPIEALLEGRAAFTPPVADA